MKKVIKFYDWITVGAFMLMPMFGVNLIVSVGLFSAYVLYGLPNIFYILSLLFLCLSVIGTARIVYHYIIKGRKGKIQDRRKR